MTDSTKSILSKFIDAVRLGYSDDETLALFEQAFIHLSTDCYVAHQVRLKYRELDAEAAKMARERS